MPMCVTLAVIRPPFYKRPSARVGVRAVEVRPPDRAAGADLGPVDVRGVDRHPADIGRAGDEALVGVRAVEVGL